MSEAQRNENRVDVAGRIDAVFLCGAEAPTIQVMNLNRGGAALRAEEPIASVMERAELRMRCAGGNGDWVDCACEVRYILGENRPDGEPAWLHGVRFLEIPEPAEAFIARMLGSPPA